MEDIETSGREFRYGEILSRAFYVMRANAITVFGLTFLFSARNDSLRCR